MAFITRSLHPTPILTAALALACQGNASTAAPEQPRPHEERIAGEERAARSAPESAPLPVAPAAGSDTDAPVVKPEPDPGPDRAPARKVTAPPAHDDGVTCDNGKHKAGERWKVDCNECWCTDDGKVMCTRMACK